MRFDYMASSETSPKLGGNRGAEEERKHAETKIARLLISV